MNIPVSSLIHDREGGFRECVPVLKGITNHLKTLGIARLLVNSILRIQNRVGKF